MKVKRMIALLMMVIVLLFMTACSTGQNSGNAQESGNVQDSDDAQSGSGEVVNPENESLSSEDALKDEIETAVVEFEYACQTSDVDAMIDCLDPGLSQALKSGRLLLNWMSSESDSDEMVMDTMLISLMNIADITVDLSTIKIEITDIKALEEIATVEAYLSLECSTGTYEDEISIRMSRDSENHKWYITGITA